MRPATRPLGAIVTVCLAVALTEACAAIVGVDSVSVGEDAGAPQQDGTVTDVVGRRDRSASDADATMHHADAVPPDARADHVDASDAHADRGEPVDARSDHIDASTDARPDHLSDTGTHDTGAHDTGMHDAGTHDTGQDTGGPPLTYPEVVLADKPLAYWRLGELPGSTSALDDTGNGYTGTYASCKLGAPGAIKNDPNTAVTFDGDGGTEVALGTNFDFSGVAAFTVEAWIKPAALDSTYRPIFVHEGNNTGGYAGYGLIVDGTKGLSVERFTVGIRLNAVFTTEPSVTEFTYVVGVYTGPGTDGGTSAGQLILYVNDGPPVSGTDTRSLGALNATAFIGSYGPGAADYVAPFDGTVDEVAIYNYALPPGRVSTHYKVGTGVPP